MSIPKVPLSDSGLPIDRERAIKTFPWINFFSLSFPSGAIPKPYIVKLAKDRLKRYLDEDEISYFYIFERTPENGKPHIHAIVDRPVDRARVHRLWIRCLPDYEPGEVHWGLAHSQPIDPQTIDGDLFGYLTKQHGDATFRAAWKEELRKKYDIGYVWGVGGRNFHYHYSSVRIGMLNTGELQSEVGTDSLSTKLLALNDHLESHQFQLTVTALERLETGTDPTQRTHFHHLMSVFFNVGASAFEKLLADYLAGYDKTSYETDFKKYLAHLTFRPILKLLALKMSVVIRNASGTKWPAFLHDLFYAVAVLNQTAYKKYIKTAPQDVDKETVFKLGLMFFSMFEVTFHNFLRFTIQSGFGDDSGSSKQQLFCCLNPDNPLALGLGDKLYDLFHEFKYPMVIPPKPWTLDDPHSGGFRANGTKIKIPLCDSRDAQFIPNQAYLDGLNALVRRPLTVNYQFIQFCHSSPLAVSTVQMEGAKDLIQSVHKRFKTDDREKVVNALVRTPKGLTADDYNFARSCLAQYHSEKIVYKGYEEIRRLARSFLKNDYPSDGGLQIYFPDEVDYRGRVYPDTDLSYTATKLSRYALQSALPQPFVLREFKIYAVKVYLGSRNRKSPVDAVAYFDTVLGPRLVDFESEPSVYLDSDDPYAMVACCLEYQRFRSYRESLGNSETALDTYRSKFFVSIDGTASGPQIIASMLRNGALARELNICPLHAHDKPGNVYLGTLERFMAFLKSNPGLLQEWIESGFNEPSNYKKSHRPGDTPEVVHVKVFYPIFKHILMAGSYGLTEHTFFEETFELLRHEGFDFAASLFAKNAIWNYVYKNTFLGDYMAFMEIVTDYLVKNKIAVSYPTPLGARVELRHIQMEKVGEVSFYKYSAESVAKMIGEGTRKRASDTLSETKGNPRKIPKSGSKHKVTISQPTGDIDFRALANSLPANVIHAADASLVIKSALEIDPAISFTAVHDCFYFPTDQTRNFYAVLQKNFYKLFFARDYLRESFIPAMPTEIRPQLLAKLDEIQAKHPFDPTFLLSPSEAGNALFH